MKKKYIGILSGCLMTAVIGLVFAKAGFTMSWFDQDKDIPQNLRAESVASYFGGGKGTATEPYLIRGARHFYNLAWLQYLGRFNEPVSDEDTDGKKTLNQYYFQLENDIDMDGYFLPPIGTTANPFIGNFNGNDHVVKNLVVTDDFSKMERRPVKASEYVENNILKDCDIIGTFGVVGLYDTQMNKYTISNEINAVTGLYLDNVEIRPSKTNVLAGILCGYSGGSITNSGAHYCKLNLKKGTSRLSKYDKISKYTLIGDYDNSRVTGKGDYGYGSSLDLKKLSEMLSNYSDFKATGEQSIQVKSGYAIPLYADSNNQGVTYDETKKTASIQGWTGIGSASGMISYDITQAHSWKANNDNIGYYVGSDCKLYNDTNLSSFIPKDETSLPFYNPVTNEKISDSSVSDIRQYFMEQANNDTSNPIYSMRLTGDQPKLDKKEDFVYIDNGTIQGMQENIVAPTRCIWIAPRYSGTFRFVFYGKNASFTLKKIMRMNPKGSSYGYGFDCDAYNDVSNENLLKYDSNNIQNKRLYYFTYHVTQEEINKGTEFVLSYFNTTSSSAPYFCYLDVGQNGGGQQKVNVIENVDFIKTNGTGYIFTDNSTFNLSNVTFEISFTPDKNTAETFIFYFRRHNDDGIGVLYYVNRDDQSGYPSYIAKKGSGNYGYAKDLNCNSKAF